jgi:cytochrome b6-f complex iron-sulfur subunit
MTDPTIDRRHAIAAGAVGAAGLLAAGCGASSGGGGASSSSSSSAASGTPIVALDKVPVGSAVSAKSPDGRPIIVAQPKAGTAVAFSAICTHMGCTVAPSGDKLNCPCHGSVYQAATGAVVQGPAPRALAKVSVKVVNGDVVTA